MPKIGFACISAFEENIAKAKEINLWSSLESGNKRLEELRRNSDITVVLFTTLRPRSNGFNRYLVGAAELLGPANQPSYNWPRWGEWKAQPCFKIRWLGSHPGLSIPQHEKCISDAIDLPERVAKEMCTTLARSGDAQALRELLAAHNIAQRERLPPPSRAGVSADIRRFLRQRPATFSAAPADKRSTRRPNH